MRSESPTKRIYCTTCERPQNTCICQWISLTPHQVEVVVLQHPLEVANAKGSARLLHLSLPHSRLVTGEVFSEQALQALLTEPLNPATQAPNPKRAMLLYPPTPNSNAVGMPAPINLEPELMCDPAQLRLIVLDGTWRKSRKMLYLNPLLRSLPRLSLSDVPESHYLIRKAQGPDQLSTLEATCLALMQLEGTVERFRPLLAAFDGFVAQQAGYQRGIGKK